MKYFSEHSRSSGKEMDNRITQIISAAEKHIESKQYAAALEQLSAAEQIEPDNPSIHMTRDLVKSLQADYSGKSPLRQSLATTVDPKSPTGMASPSLDEVQKRIRSLTSTAEYLLSRGAVDNAFESLMRAYLLDPVAPDVLACERRVLPAWQLLHGKTPDDVAEAKREWKLDIITQKQPKTHSTLFDRLKIGKFRE